MEILANKIKKMIKVILILFCVLTFDRESERVTVIRVELCLMEDSF